MSSDAIKGCAASDKVRQQIHNVLRAWNMPEETAAVTEQLMVQTELLGNESHGISMLP
jgi:LDH2 family malate/lactate/ureidoglycolate dehydrogenase